MLEQWREIPGYDGVYRVSNLGRIWSGYVDRCLRPQRINSGYLTVHLYLAGKRRVALVHRLVAQAFAVGSGPEVNHRSGAKQDNAAKNLEWTDRSGNVQHALEHGLHRRAEHLKKAVVGLSPEGVRVEFPSQIAAERALSGTHRGSSAIHHCLVGKKKSAYGHTWSRA